LLEGAGIHVSVDGRGRALDSIFIERFWRSLKYEDIYLCDYATVPDLEDELQRYFAFYNHERPHQSLNYAVPGKVHQDLVTLVC
jgi:putative transposase